MSGVLRARSPPGRGSAKPIKAGLPVPVAAVFKVSLSTEGTLLTHSVSQTSQLDVRTGTANASDDLRTDRFHEWDLSGGERRPALVVRWEEDEHQRGGGAA